MLWGLGSFVFLQLGLAVAIELWLPQFRAPYYAPKAARLEQRLCEGSGCKQGMFRFILEGIPFFRRTWPQTAPEAKLILVLGSSRTADGFRGADLEGPLSREMGVPVIAFNFGLPGAGPLTELLTLKRLLANGVRPDLVVIEVLPPLLAGQEPVASAELGRFPATGLWLSEFEFVQHYGGPASEQRRDWWEAWPIPCYAQRQAILSCLAPAWLPYQYRRDWFRNIDDSGWVDSPLRDLSPERRRLAVEHARLDYAPILEHFQLGGPACQALRDLLALCRQEDIRTALLLMPEGTEFRSWYPPRTRLAIEAFLQGLSGKFNAPVIDAREWIADDDFSDSHHLQPEGAAKFTERLGRTTLLPLLRQAGASQGPTKAD
jgi:hypothetical protein